MMIKYILVSAFFLMALLLAACTTDSPNEKASAGQVEEATPFVENEVLSQEETTQRELPDSTQLILGTFKLEQTDRKIDQGQAAALLPLWKAYRALLESDSAAQEELDAVIRQIQENMTPEQLEVLENTENNPEASFALLQELGVMPESVQQAEGSNGDQSPGGGFRGGGLPGGAGMGGGQGPGVAPGGDLSPEQRETLQAERGGTAGPGNRFGAMLIDPLIELLEERATG
jgi:hypothetical protein